jgi:hypothetical protein
MNKTNMLALAAHLETLEPLGPVGFNMAHYWKRLDEFDNYYRDEVISAYPNATECGCIAGHARLLMDGDKPDWPFIDPALVAAWLDLAAPLACQLFNTNWDQTAAEAAAKLRAIVAGNPEDFAEGYEDPAAEGGE